MHWRKYYKIIYAMKFGEIKDLSMEFIMILGDAHILKAMKLESITT